MQKHVDLRKNISIGFPHDSMQSNQDVLLSRIMEDLASKRAQNSSFGGTSSLQPAIFETDFKIAERGEQKSNKGKIE